jgi:citrate synthase
LPAIVWKFNKEVSSWLFLVAAGGRVQCRGLRHFDIHQRYKLLAAVKIAITQVALGQRPVKELCDLEPDFVFANAYGHSRLGLESRQSLFPLGRSVGWVAHSIEQFEAGETIRASESYTGQLPSLERRN